MPSLGMLAKGLGSSAREGRGKGDFPLPGGGVIPFPAPPLPQPSPDHTPEGMEKKNEHARDEQKLAKCPDHVLFHQGACVYRGRLVNRHLTHLRQTPPQQMNKQNLMELYSAMYELTVMKNVPSGARIYVIKAELVQRPSAWMVESASAADVAAPIRKL